MVSTPLYLLPLFLLSIQQASQQGSQPTATGDTPPYLVVRPAPDTTACGQAANATALTVLALTVDTKGTPHAIHVQTSSGDKCLDEAAVAVGKRYQFRPAILRGKPTVMEIAVNVPFDPPASAAGSSAEAPPRLNGGPPCKMQPDHGAPVVSVKLDVHGQPVSVAIFQSSGDPCADKLALEAARRYHFEPAMKYGAPVPVELHIEVNLYKPEDVQVPPS